MGITDIKAPLKASSVPGVYMKGISIRQSKEWGALADKAQAQANENPDTLPGMEHVRWLFEHVLVDENGELFADRDDIEGIDMVVLAALSRDVTDFLVGPVESNTAQRSQNTKHSGRG